MNCFPVLREMLTGSNPIPSAGREGASYLKDKTVRQIKNDIQVVVCINSYDFS